jgi:transcriptional regulator with XRE-family HTH domain
MAQAGSTSDTAGAVRAELARRRLSGRDLAAALGWSERTLRRRLGGDLPFTVDELLAVAKFLEIPVAELLPRAEQVPA